MDRLRKLASLLYQQGYRDSAYQVFMISKLSYVNNAYIKIIHQDFHVTAKLMGDAEGHTISYGEVVMYEVTNVTNLQYEKVFHVHSGVSDEIKGLGYGRDLYLAAIKYASDNGWAVLSGPLRQADRSEDALKVHQRLSQIPGINSREVLLMDSESGVGIFDLQSSEAKRYLDGVDDLESLKSSPLIDFSSGEPIKISIGNLIVANNEARLPISLPSQVVYEDDSENNIEGFQAQQRRLQTIQDIRFPDDDADEEEDFQEFIREEPRRPRRLQSFI